MRRIRWTAAVAAVLTMVAAGAGSAPAATSVSGAGAPAANSASGAGAARAPRAAARSAGVRAGAPGRPRYLGISITGRRAVLTWTAGRGLARIAAYRVYRDGRLLRRVRGTRATVAVRPGAPQRLSVRAVDVRGRRSAAAVISTASSKEAPQ